MTHPVEMNRRHLHLDDTFAVLCGWDDGEIASYAVRIFFDVTFGEPETGAGYLADPERYDPGSGDVVSFKGAAEVGPVFGVLLPLSPDHFLMEWARKWVERNEEACVEHARAMAQERAA